MEKWMKKLLLLLTLALGATQINTAMPNCPKPKSCAFNSKQKSYCHCTIGPFSKSYTSMFFTLSVGRYSTKFVILSSWSSKQAITIDSIITQHSAYVLYQHPVDTETVILDAGSYKFYGATLQENSFLNWYNTTTVKYNHLAMPVTGTGPITISLNEINLSYTTIDPLAFNANGGITYLNNSKFNYATLKENAFNVNNGKISASNSNFSYAKLSGSPIFNASSKTVPSPEKIPAAPTFQPVKPGGDTLSIPTSLSGGPGGSSIKIPELTIKLGNYFVPVTLDLSNTNFTGTTLPTNTFYTSKGVISLQNTNFTNSHFNAKTFYATAGGIIALTGANFKGTRISKETFYAEGKGSTIDLSGTDFTGALLWVNNKFVPMEQLTSKERLSALEEISNTATGGKVNFSTNIKGLTTEEIDALVGL
jgi:uncharacterized protein YjbI with pentapeptide repeats